jgi:hypothetical protein
MFSIVYLPLYSSMESYSPHLDHLLTWVNGKDSVSMVLILYLSVIEPYMPGRVVDHGGRSPPPVYRTSGALYYLDCFKFRP